MAGFNPFINARGKLRNGWWIAIFFVVLAALLLPLILTARGGNESVAIWKQALIVIMATVICQVLRRRFLSEAFGRFDVRWTVQFLIGCGLGALLMLAPASLLFVLGAVHWSAGGSADVLAPSLALFVAVAVTEEVLFRGFIFQRLLDGLGVWPAQLLIAALFVLTHSDALQHAGAIGLLAGVNIFIASLMFGAAYLRTRSLALPIGLHFAANFVQGGVLGFGVSGNEEAGLLRVALNGPDWLTGGAFGLEASAPGLLAVMLLTALLWLAPRRPVTASAAPS
jgi:membrane protease YdiL (CAAX protease family)